MAKKKKTDTPEVAAEEKQPIKEKRPPQMVTVNGDKVSNAHVFKSTTGDDWFFTAKINDVPLRSKVCAPEDVEAMMNKTASVEKMMEKYYPTKLMKRLSNEEISLPSKIIGNNEQELIVHKFLAYKERNAESMNYGKYMFYTQIGDRKMSTLASPKQLDEYFDRVKAPSQMVTQIFGDRLNLKAYYEQFKLPDGVDAKDIRIQKNHQTNRYEISAKIGNARTTPTELNYDDRVSYFQSKTATKEQLGAKYFSDVFPQMFTNAENQKTEIKQEVPSLKI